MPVGFEACHLNRPCRRAGLCGRLELHAGKPARAVLRGGTGSDAGFLLDCYECTESLLNSKKAQYPSHYTSDRMPKYRRDIENGEWAADCIGLAKGYMWWDDELGRTRYGTNGCPDKSANGMKDYASVGGDISTLPETPGMMLWKDGHVGIYVGDGWAVEARGFDYGIVRTRVSERGWRRWFELPGCKYGEGAVAGDFVVTATSLNVRSGPGTDYEILDVVHNGDALTSGAREGWTPIELSGRVGWVSDKYIEVVE